VQSRASPGELSRSAHLRQAPHGHACARQARERHHWALRPLQAAHVGWAAQGDVAQRLVLVVQQSRVPPPGAPGFRWRAAASQRPASQLTFYVLPFTPSSIHLCALPPFSLKLQRRDGASLWRQWRRCTGGSLTRCRLIPSHAHSPLSTGS
jgi:hypothetical protein